jgi:protein-tyrosine kinase
MRRQTLVSSLDDTAFGADLAARGPFDFLRRLWKAMFRANSGGESSPVKERCPAVRETPPAVQETRPATRESSPVAPEPNRAVPEVAKSTAVLDEPQQTDAVDRPASSATFQRSPTGGELRPTPVSDATRELRRQCESIVQGLRQSHGGAEAGPRVIGLTSCYAGEGVTTLATHLAQAAAHDGPVLLADLNFAAPGIHKMCGAQLGPGLAEWLQNGRSAPQEVAVPNGSLTLVTAGSALAADCGSYVERMREFLRYAADNFDFTFLDLPPLSGSSDALPVGELLDGVLLVVQSERVRWPVAKRFLTQMMRSGAKPLGAVLNKRRQYIPNWAYRTL